MREPTSSGEIHAAAREPASWSPSGLIRRCFPNSGLPELLERFLSGGRRDAARLIGSTAAAQGLVIVCAPIITRLFSVEAVGIAGLFSTLLVFSGTLATCRMEAAISFAPDDAEARKLASAVRFSAVVVSLLIAAIVWMIPGEAFTASWHPAIRYWLPLASLAFAFYQADYQLAVRTHEVRTAAWANLLRSVVMNATQIVAGLVNAGPSGLMAGVVLGQASRGVFTRLGALFRPRLWVAAGRDAIEMFQAHARFPVWVMPQAVANLLTGHFPILFLASSGAETVLGHYSLAYRVLQLPIILIAGALRPLFARQFTERAGDLAAVSRRFRSSTLRLLAVASVPFGTVMVLGPWIFRIVFGPNWEPAGEVARWMALWLLIAFINVPAVSLGIVLGMQRRFLALELAFGIARCLALWWITREVSMYWGIAAFCVVGAVYNSVLIGAVAIRCRGTQGRAEA